MIEHAFAALERGFHVFPCKPRDKHPLSSLAPHGVKDATNDKATIEKWWTICPDANPAVALGPSNLTVLDADSGLETFDQAKEWRDRNRLPLTFAVRTGRRTSFGLQLYFRGTSPNRPYFHDGVKGEVRSSGYYVLAAGAIHPVSGEPYLVLRDAPPAPVPELVTRLTKATAPRPQGKDEELVSESQRHFYLVERAREFHFAGLTGEGLTQALTWLYFNRCQRDPAKDERVKRGELKDISAWVEEHPPQFKLEPRDFRQVRFLDKRYPKAARAWGGDTSEFSDAEDALTYLIQALADVGCGQEQIARIVGASPLYEMTHA